MIKWMVFISSSSRTIPLTERPLPTKLASANSSFQNFQEATEDVWDVGDDEFCQISGEERRYMYVYYAAKEDFINLVVLFLPLL